MVSHIYPERAIRPLPRSRLKSRLSPEQACSIVYPPEPPEGSPSLSFEAHDNGVPPRQLPNGDADGRYPRHDVHDHCMCRHDDGESGDDEVEFDNPDYRYSTSAAPSAINGKAVLPLDSVQRRFMDSSRLAMGGKAPGASGSVASSADGYESFENSSNKKKRKIPLSSASGSMHHSSLSAELASMGLSRDSAIDDPSDTRGSTSGLHADSAAGPSSAAANGICGAGTGISGAGRGRYGRKDGRDARRPLASTTINTINAYAGRMPQRSSHGMFRALPARDGVDLAIRSNHPSMITDQRMLDPHSTSPAERTPGIISRAIRTAAEAGPLTPQKGKENVSLLQQSASPSVTSPKTQFTFTCESDSASKMSEQLPGAADLYRERAVADYATPSPATGQRDNMVNGLRGQATSAQGAQAALRGSAAGPGNVASARAVGYPLPSQQHPPPPSQQHQAQSGQQQQQPQPQPATQKPPRPRRSPSKEYALAARQRKLQQQYSNYHHRPRREDMWVCQFCEYEDIFGVPPVALIRSYEIKDRQERKKAAEKQRLLEKAKQRGRKGKKGSGKNSGSKGQGASGAAAAQGHGYDQHGAPIGDGDDYYDDDDEYDPVGPDGEGDYDDGEYYPQPPPVPLGTPRDVGTPDPRTPPNESAAAGG